VPGTWIKITEICITSWARVVSRWSAVITHWSASSVEPEMFQNAIHSTGIPLIAFLRACRARIGNLPPRAPVQQQPDGSRTVRTL